MHGFKHEMDGKLDNIFLSLDSKVGTNDMKVNFKIVSDIMYVKFKQLEDTKAAARDLIAYQKYFYPMQLQAAIGKNIAQLASAK